jgi:hypothetical protein
MVVIMVDNDNIVVCKGCILISDTTRHGKVLDIVIETENLQQYRIVPNQMGMDLIDYVYKDVIVTGRMNIIDDYSTPIIVVESFQVIS